MLDKISNISAGSEYGKSVNTGSFNGLVGGAYNRKIGAHDSVNISPAMKFLTQVNWKLKEFKHIVNEKLSLTFLVSDLEIQTTIDLFNINISNVEYRIIKDRKGKNWKSRIFLDLNSVPVNIKYTDEPSLINFSALNLLFQRIFDLNVFNEITDQDRFLITELLADIRPGIQEEFKYLNSFLFSFVDKLTGVKIVKREDINNDAESIIIKKIKVLNAE